MKFFHRRQFLHLAGGAAALPGLSVIARAQSYPTRPVHIIAGFPAGGPVDFGARIAGEILSERLAQNFLVENHPGAAGNIAIEMVMRLPADGYTLLAVGPPAAINATLYQNLEFNFLRDLAPVAGVCSVPYVMEVTPSLPAKTIEEFIAYARANPGKVNFSSSGNGTGQHIAGEMFRIMTGVDMVHVPYRGTPDALVDLMAGRVQMMIDPISSSIEHIRAGKLRALAVASLTRSDALPELPTIDEFVPGFEMTAWYGVCAPKKTPADIVNRLNEEINAGLGKAAVKKHFVDLGADSLIGPPAEFGKRIEKDTEKWGEVIRTAHITAM